MAVGVWLGVVVGVGVVVDWSVRAVAVCVGVSVAGLPGVGLGVAVGIVLAIGVPVAVGVGEPAGSIGTTVTSETMRSRSPSKAALTRKSISPAVNSVTSKRSAKMPSPAATSPLVPSSRMVPRTAMSWLVASVRNSSTLAGISTGSPGPVVIVLVAVTRVVTPTPIVPGTTTGAPTPGVAWHVGGSSPKRKSKHRHVALKRRVELCCCKDYRSLPRLEETA